MTELAKLAAAYLGSAVIVSSIWYGAGLSFLDGPFPVWHILSILSIATLIATFEVSVRNIQRLAGVTLLLSGLLVGLGMSNADVAFGKSNILDVLNRHGELGVICVGAALLIITGGIDLSVGSLMGLAAISFGIMMENGIPPIPSLVLVLAIGMVAGITHGLLVTQLHLQAFLVTLCGMFVYRGLARTICTGQTGIHSVSTSSALAGEDYRTTLLDLRYWLTGQHPQERLVFPAQLVVLLVLAAVAAVFLHRSAFGRYWYAIGYNPQAARYAGVNVSLHKIAMFAVCSTLAAFAGILMFLRNSVSPSSAGQDNELYAITAVVLGGVSLRGGEGTAIGIVLGAMILPVVRPLMLFTNCPDEWIPWMIGLILLFGTIADELIRRRSRVNR